MMYVNRRKDDVTGTIQFRSFLYVVRVFTQAFH